MNYVSRRGGEGVCQMLMLAYEGEDPPRGGGHWLALSSLWMAPRPGTISK